MGRIGDADPDQMFYYQPIGAIQLEVPQEDTLGPDEGRGLL